MTFRKFHDYVENNLMKHERCLDELDGKMRIEAPLKQRNFDTFSLLNQMGIDWTYDKRGKTRGRQKSELGLYKT